MHTSLREALAALYSRFDADQLVERYSAAAKLVAEEERRRVRQVGVAVASSTLTLLGLAYRGEGCKGTVVRAVARVCRTA
jgi:hypothetical protein